MQVTLPPELVKIVQEYLLAGQYQSPIEVLQAGLQSLQAGDEAIYDTAARIEQLKRTGAQMDSLLQEHGLTEDELVQEFRQLRKQGHP